jgi:hypothetical protein
MRNGNRSTISSDKRKYQDSSSLDGGHTTISEFIERRSPFTVPNTKIKTRNGKDCQMFSDWRRERFMRSILRKLSRQQVTMVLQPGNIWVVEKALTSSEEVDAALLTCHVRGWVEILENSIRKGTLTPDGKLPSGNLFSRYGPTYRLTDAGWNTIHRTHPFSVVTCAVSIAALIAVIIGLVIHLK